MKTVSLLDLSIIIICGTIVALGHGIGVSPMIASIWFLLPIPPVPIAGGGHYVITNRRVVREKFPYLQQLELREIKRVRPPNS